MIGFIGTGLMGNPMVMKLQEGNLNVGAFNRSINKTHNLREAGVEIFTDLKDLINESEVIVMMLTEFNSIISVMQDCWNLVEGKTIIQMSTITPEENIRLAEKFISHNAKMLEAPVLGSIPQVKSGELMILTSGSVELHNECKPILKCFGNKISYFGEYGKASTAKLALNQLIATLTTAFSMSLGYIINNDVDLETFMNILRKSALYAPTFDKKLDKMLNRNFKNPNFPLKHLLKDVKLIEKSFANSGIETSTIKGVQTVIERGIELNYGEEDYSALYNSVNELSGLNES